MIVLAAGKAAGSMTEVAEQHYCDAALPNGDRGSRSRVTAMAGRLKHIPMIEAGHPVPDEAGLRAARG